MPVAVLSTIPKNVFAKPIGEDKIDFSNPIEFFKYIGELARNLKDTTDNVVKWFKNFKTNIAEISVDLMTGSYDFLTSIVLHTPVFLFDNNWFKGNILNFTGLGIIGIILIAVWEGFKRMSTTILPSKRPVQYTDLKRIIKRVPLVILGSAIAPATFVYGFKVINWLTDTLTDISTINMKSGVSDFNFLELSYWEILSYFGFTVALIYMLIPILLRNFSRWFKLIALGILSPLALASWVFKSTEHFFHQFWSSLKRNSLTQLVYALFLLIIGSLMFYGKPPENSWELLIKMGVMIGGFNVMNSAQDYVGRYIDRGEDITDFWKGASGALTPKGNTKKIVSTGISTLDKTGEFIYRKAVPTPIKKGIEKVFGSKKLY